MSEQNFSEIKNLKKFLEECLAKPILEYSLKPLTKPGDKNGAELQAVEVKVTDKYDINHSIIITKYLIKFFTT